VHERLGLDWAAVDLIPSDSDAVGPGAARGGGTGVSRSLIKAGRVLILAAEAAVERARALAAEALEVAAADLTFSAAEGGLFHVAGADLTVTLTALAAQAGGVEGAGEVRGREATHPNGRHVAEVEIDPETGRLSVVRHSVADDFGRIANPLLPEGQGLGGVAQGLGQALMEAMRWDPATGQPLTATLMDYALPRAADVPPVTTAFNEAAPTPSNPLGAKGCCEAGAVAATPAVTLAALDALRAAGVRDAVDTLLTPERLWRAPQGRADGEGASGAAA
jgi:carbon-monoxide dehydrogenase large subunit